MFDNETLFVGREKSLALIHNHITRPDHHRALALIGRAGMGKTTLLRHFDSMFDPSLVWGLYVPLGETPLTTEANWLRVLFECMLEAAVTHGFSRERLPVIPSGSVDWRAWLKETGLPELFHVVRAARRVVILIDDAGVLLDKIARGAFPADHPAYLQSLIQPQLDIILTLNDPDEMRLSALAPLVDAAEAFRLVALTREAVGAGLSAIHGGEVADTLIDAAYSTTGGHPLLLQRLLAQLTPPITPESIKAAAQTVYTQSGALFRDMWQNLTANEQIVLTAISKILYEDPLAALSPDRLAQWLLDSNDPLDVTTVSAALRGLEYAEIVSHAGGGFTVRAALMQRWLIENARLTAPTVSAAPTGEQRRALFALIAVALVVLLVIALALTFSGLPAPTPPDAILSPTVTLANP